MKRFISIMSFVVLILIITMSGWAAIINVPGHYSTIQAAIDNAWPGDIINVAAGTYSEYLIITTDNLTIEGAGIDQSIIDLDGLMPYWHYSPTGHFASRAGVLISGYDGPGGADEIVQDIVFRGFTVKNAGLNPPGGGAYAEFWDADGDGQDDVRGIVVANGKNILIQNCKVENSGYNGIGVGKARLTGLTQSENVTIDGCISSDNWETGISVGDYVGAITITNNICSNNKRPHPDPSAEREYSAKGIEVSGKKGGSPPMSGLISGNTCSDNGYQGIVLKNYSGGVLSDGVTKVGVTVENNRVTGHNFDQDGAGIFFYGDKSNPANCKNNIIRNNKVEKNIRGIIAYYASDCTIEGNTIKTDSGVFPEGQEAIKIDGSNNILVKDNNISCDGVGIGVQNTWNGIHSYDNTFTGNSIKKAKFAGIRIGSGAHDNTFMYNTIKDTKLLTRWAGETYEETQGDGVIIDNSAGLDNIFNYNNIYNNDDDGMENQIATEVNAECNWWGHYSGPSGVGLGDAVNGNIDFDPWLVLPQGSIFELKEVKIEFKKKANDDKIHVKGNLGFGCGTEISVLDVITVTVGTVETFSETIPGGTVEEKGNDGEKWEYKRPKHGEGFIKELKIDWKKGEFDIKIDKAELGDISEWPNPCTITIQIGDDSGQQTVDLTEDKDKLEYK